MGNVGAYWLFVIGRVNRNNASNTRVVKVTRQPHQLSNGCNVPLQLQLGVMVMQSLGGANRLWIGAYSTSSSRRLEPRCKGDCTWW